LLSCKIYEEKWVGVQKMHCWKFGFGFLNSKIRVMAAGILVVGVLGVLFYLSAIYEDVRRMWFDLVLLVEWSFQRYISVA